MKKVFWVLLAVGAVVLVAKKSHWTSYATTAWTQVQHEAKRSVPTKFELERVRGEIAQLDNDILRMIRPVAEYKVDLVRLRVNVARVEEGLSEQKKVLLSLTEELATNPEFVDFGGERLSAERVRQKVQRDFDTFKRQETSLKAQQKLLEAKERASKATQDQMAKVISKKREYEVRLAQLEAEAETLQVAQIGSRLPIDDSRATQIEVSLNALERRLWQAPKVPLVRLDSVTTCLQRGRQSKQGESAHRLISGSVFAYRR